ncbi:MAG: type IV toxin-antitoxin system AbiEi family antitoxin domain-containing protein [Nitrososphaerales archaeon]
MGEEYFIEIKPRPLNRFDIGRALEQSAAMLREKPSAKTLLVCSSLDPSVRDLLNRAGIRAFTFSELNIDKPPGEKPPETLLRLSPSEQQSYFALLRAGKKVVRTREFQSLLGVPVYSAKNTLAALCRRGVLFRLGRGKYSVLPADIVYERKSYTADPLIVLGPLMEKQEYYVAYGSAAHLHGVSTQIPLTTFVAVTRQRRQIDMGTARIRFVNVKRSRFFGKIEREHFGSRIFASDLEKTIIDCFDRSDLVGGIESAARMLYDSFEKLDFSKLLDYAKRMQRNALVQRLGFVLEKLRRICPGIPDSVLEGIDKAAEIRFSYVLDPNIRKKGKFSKRWYIYENVDCLRWYRG